MVLRTHALRTRRVLRVALYLVVVTLVFDNLLSALPVYVFDRDRTLGVFLPFAPLEDLGYIVGVVLLVAVLDAAVGARAERGTSAREGRIRTPGAARRPEGTGAGDASPPIGAAQVRDRGGPRA
ncbi:hypothetical protein GCM10009869_29800 [Amnibacterium kyonggiense]